MKRKRLSIKTRVTLWYTTLLAVLVGLVVAAVLVMSDSMEEMQAKKLLETAVNHAADLLVYDGEDVTFLEPVETYENGTYLLFYDENYRFLDGSWPQKFPNGVDAANRAFQAIRRGNTTYYVYDHLLEFASGGVWIRGIYEATGAQFILDNVVRVILIALPALAALAALGGWLITRNAFRVVDELRQQADSISGGQDLSRRIPVNGERDELHRLAGTLNRMFDRLEDSFQAEQQFISDVSHELRTPTAVILAECQYALESGQMAEQTAALEVIQRQGKRMSRMTEEMLTLSRMERGQTQLAREETDLTELVEVICEDQQELLPEHLTLRWELEPVMAEVHQDMMIRLVINLLNNAVRYAKSKIMVTLTCQNDTVTLTVADDGAGIAPEHQKRIFQRLYQVEGDRTRKSGGLGLGLAMCDQIIRQHGGPISVESTLGEGSRFLVTFPARQPTMGQHNTAEPTQSNSDNTGAVSDAAPQQSDDQPASSAKQESTAPVMTGYLPRGDAIQIALRHAGLKQADICDLSCKLEEENGVMIYQVEFEHGQYEYEYEIDAKSGKILDVDIDD